MAGLSGNTERDLVMLMTKLTEFMQKNMNAQVGRSGSKGKVQIDLQSLIKEMDLTEDQFTELRDVLQNLNMTAEELSEHMTLSVGGLKKFRPRLKTLDSSTDKFSRQLENNATRLKSLDKQSAELVKALHVINADSIDLDIYMRELRSKIAENSESLKNLTGTEKELDATQQELKLQLEQKIEADQAHLEAIIASTDAESRRLESLERLDAAQDNLKEVSISTYSKLGDFNVVVERLARQNEELTDMAAKAARSSALQNAAQIEFSDMLNKNSIEYLGYIDALKDSSSAVPEAMLRMAGMLDERTKTIKDNLDADDFAKLRVSMGEAKVIAAESLRGVDGVKNVQDLVDQAKLIGTPGDPGRDEKLKTALFALAQRLETAGMLSSKASTVNRDASGKVIGTKNASQLTDAEFKQLAEDLAKFDKSVSESANKLDDLGRRSQTVVGKYAFMAKAAGGAGGMLKKFALDLGTTSIFLSNLRNAAQHVKESFNFIQGFNIAHVPASLADVGVMSVKMGVSMEDMVKILQENKRTLAIQGTQAFDGMRSGLKDTFAKFGYTAAQSAEAIGPGIEAAINSGVNVRDPAGLNTYIDQSMNAFKGISGIVNTTAAEYMRLNAQLMTDNDIMAVSLGMSKDQQVAYAASLEAQRNSLVVQGMSLEQAQELVKMREAEKRQKVVGKFRDAAMASAKMQMMGFSGEEANEFMRIKTVGPRNEQEAAYFDSMVKRMTAQEDAELGAARASGDIGTLVAAQSKYDIVNDKTGNLTQYQDQYRKLNMAEQNGTKMSKEEAAKAGQAATGSEGVAQLGNAVNSVSSLMNNVFVKALISASLAAVGLAASLARAGGMRGLLDTGKDMFRGAKGGKGFMGKIGGALKGGLGMGAPAASSAATAATSTATGASTAAASAAKGGGFLSKIGGALGKLAPAAKVAGVAGTVADVGLGVNDLLDGKAQKEMSGLDYISPMRWGMWTGDKINSGIEKLTGGQSLGSKVYDWIHGDEMAKLNAPTPISPTVAGKPNAIIAAPAAVATPGPNSMPGMLNSTPSTSKAVNKESDTKDIPALLQVSDQTANQKLETIAQSLTEMLEYLKQMAESDTPAAPRAAEVSRRFQSQVPTAQQYISGRANA